MPASFGVPVRWKVLLALAAVLFLSGCIYGQPEVKYRLTYDIETPSGIKQASTVIRARHVTPSWPFSILLYPSPSVQGDAAFLDLGEGRLLVVLLETPEERLAWLPLEVFGVRKRPDESLRRRYWRLADVPVGTTATLPQHRRPFMIVLMRSNDPTSAVEVKPGDFGPLGPGYDLKDARMEIVANETPIPRVAHTFMPRWGEAKRVCYEALKAAGLRWFAYGNIKSLDFFRVNNPDPKPNKSY